MNKATAESICKLNKFCQTNFSWQDKVNQTSLLQASSVVDDDTGATIPGITIVLEVKKESMIGRWQFELGLFKLEDGIKHRVYQLHSSPEDKRSHNDARGSIYGSHEHIGEQKNGGDVLKVNLNSAEFLDAFEIFCRKINLSFTGKLNLTL